MLIEISIENFRSIRGRQTFSMAAAPLLRTRKENFFEVNLKGDKLPSLLKVAAIYGPNASGKSTIVRALALVRRIIDISPSVSQGQLPVAPFRFDSALRDRPSRVEVHFITDGTRYAFDLAATADRVHEERLTAYYDGKETVLYERELVEGEERYKFPALEGGRELHEAWRRLTAPRTLFIAQAVANSSEDLQQLRSPLNWFRNALLVVERGLGNLSDITQRVLIDVPQYAPRVAGMLSDVDVPVSQISSRLEDSADVAVGSPIYALDSGSRVRTTLTHRTALGEAEFDFSEESEGTKNIFGFALPWLLMQRNDQVNRHARVLVVDELDSSLHPKVVEALIERHVNDPIACQLIFTTHDTHLMDAKLLRRDQIWFTERDGAGATQLRSAHDFKGRNDEDVEKRYYEGRYRALPLVRRSS